MFLVIWRVVLIIQYFRMESDDELPDLPYTPQYRKACLSTGLQETRSKDETPDWARSRSRSRGREDEEPSECSKVKKVGMTCLSLSSFFPLFSLAFAPVDKGLPMQCCQTKNQTKTR